MTFHNRKAELDEVRRVLASGRSELIIVHGRRGVGKSALMREALKDERHFFYQATVHALPQQLADLGEALLLYAPDSGVSGALVSVHELWSNLGRMARERPEAPVVAVIDEASYLDQADASGLVLFQRWWDEMGREGVKNLKVFLVSSMAGWLEKQTVSETAPLHGRLTGQVRVEPLGYADAALFYPEYRSTARIGAFAIWGGLPAYLRQIDGGSKVWENVRRTLADPAPGQAEEPIWLRAADLRADGMFASVLRAIASGCHRPVEMADAVGKRGGNEVFYHLNRLCDLGLVERRAPLCPAGARPTKSVVYKLCDHYVAFWYRYLDRFRNLAGVGQIDAAVRRIQQEFDQFVSLEALGDVCRQALRRRLAAGALPDGLRFQEIGSYWVGGGPVQDAIDIVALDGGQAVLAGACKWSASPVDRFDLQRLRTVLTKASRDLNPIDRPWRVLFSASGFSDDLQALARRPDERLLLLTPDDLYAAGVVTPSAGG